MIIEQIYTGCLAQGAYYIENNGEVAIIDPMREIKPYLDRAERDGASIKYILETHFHADFVSGHLDLAKATGATIIYGPSANPDFTAHVATDGEQLPLGNCKLVVLHTPGHTMESCCYLLRDESGKDMALFSGDTLFINDVGRPDLAQKVNPDLKEEILAGMLYDSLHQKLLPLADDIIVYPGHGAGSACGKNMSKETTDTLGHQKQYNYALQPMDKDTFIHKVLNGLTPPPGYFPKNVMMNIHGYESLEEVLKRGLNPMTPDVFETVMSEGSVLVIDTRDPQVFAKGFIPGSINIGLNGEFAPWIGKLVKDINQRIIFIAEPGREEEVVIRLSRVGYDHAIGYLRGGYAAWRKYGFETDKITTVSVDQYLFRMNLNMKSTLIDVRRPSEYNSSHVLGAINLPLEQVYEGHSQLNKDRIYYICCVGGYRSMIFISILRKLGYTNLIDMKGGFKAVQESKLIAVSEFVAQESML